MVCAVIPVLLIVTSVLAVFIGKLAAEQSEAYGVANGIASEALAAIRTVISFNGESRTVRRYGMSLDRPMQAGIQGGLFNGLIIGFSYCSFLCAFALALWYGGIRVRDGTYTGEYLVNVHLLISSLHCWAAYASSIPSVVQLLTGLQRCGIGPITYFLLQRDSSLVVQTDVKRLPSASWSQA